MERYEQLRRHAMDGEASGWRLGLALFQGRGMAAWLRACRQTAQPSAPSVDGPPFREPLGGDDLVGALATMALACVGR